MTSAKVAVPLLQEVLDAFNAHDLDLIMSFFADDCVMDMPHGPGPGAGGWWQGRGPGRASVACLDGIPDIHYGDDRHWVCDDRGVSEWTIRGRSGTASASRCAAAICSSSSTGISPEGRLLEDRRLVSGSGSACGVTPPSPSRIRRALELDLLGS